MNRVARWMIRLYPASWRARYGDEIDALLSDTGADARIVGDLARGGMRMQLKAWPFPLLALALGLAGLLLGTGIAWLIPNTYTSKATLQIENQPSVASANDEIMRMTTAVMSRASLARMIEQTGLYRDEQRVKPLEDVIDEMRRAIHIDPIKAPGRKGNVAFNIGFDYRDRVKARGTVAALIASFQDASTSLAEPRARVGKMWVVDTASLPIDPVSPTKTVIVTGGFLAGLLIAFLLRTIVRVQWIRRRFAVAALAMGLAGVILSLFAQAINLASVSGHDQKPIFWTNHFRSTASFRLQGADVADVAAIQNAALSRTSLAQIVQDPYLRLYSSEQATTPLEDIVQSMRKSISIGGSVSHGNALLAVTFEYRDRYRAQQTLTALLTKFEKAANQRLSAPGSAKPAPVLAILDRPSTPIDPAKPNRYLISGTGGICGVILAGIISLLRRRWKPEQQIPVNS